jgi:VCBS repeat-containing protein
MATYTITGHPLNTADLAVTPGAAIDANLTAALRDKGVGQSVTITLSGSDDTKAKGHGVLR